MRGRPLKVDDNAPLDETLRRARGRAAQRRYRHRQEQTLAENEGRIKKLESVVQGMISAFLDFGDHVSLSIAVPTFNETGDLGTAYHETVRRFRDLAAEVDEDISCRQDRSPNSTSDDSQQATTQSILRPSSRPQSIPLSTVDTSFKTGNSQRVPVSNANVKVVDKWPSAAAYSMHRFLSSAFISMPLQNPGLSSDYSNIKELAFPGSSLQQRLIRNGMLLNYQALHCDQEQDKRYSWCARVHRFSFRHSNKWDILFLTRLGLDKMVEASHQKVRRRSYGPASPPRQLPGSGFFDDERHQQLAAAIQNDLELEGTLSDIVRAEELDDYLATKGRTTLDGNTLELRLFSVKQCWSQPSTISSPHEDIKTVLIDTEKFLRKLCEEAICLGDGMGFAKHIVNDAIVCSAMYMSQLPELSL
ncbi:hypothetical protein AYL99_09449 [Fonsecaea erecta]|uniref:BZIP domain-containing protein n=1 Tax=Fonsecaea erecta TaxID=1367422 RepID=A0A178Z900_9EURO|nr:hypothetical protein AYL99_09449 [Fonsecaea erecta]OAP56270.1 hypothetical protein AYL99_09449 [Fonsecaea erecta]